MSYEITRRQIDRVPFLFVRRKIKGEEIAAGLGSMFGAVFEYATRKGIPFAGRPTARYGEMILGSVTIEGGMPVAAPADGEGEIQSGWLVGGPVATAIHEGPYDQLGNAHRAIEAWIAEKGEQAGGPPWEVYVTDPGEEPDPSKWQTEVNWPLAG